jgi:hypothetical protein
MTEFDEAIRLLLEKVECMQQQSKKERHILALNG